MNRMQCMRKKIKYWLWEQGITFPVCVSVIHKFGSGINLRAKTRVESYGCIVNLPEMIF